MKTKSIFKILALTALAVILVPLPGLAHAAASLTCSVDGSEGCGSIVSPVVVEAGQYVALQYTGCTESLIKWTIDSNTASDLNVNTSGESATFTVPVVNDDTQTYVQVDCGGFVLMRRTFYFEILGNDFQIELTPDTTDLTVGETTTVVVSFSEPATDIGYTTDMDYAVVSEDSTEVVVDVTATEAGSQSFSVTAAASDNTNYTDSATISFTVSEESTDTTDADGDGVTADEDCDDSDATVGAVMTLYVDADGDGYGDATTATESCEEIEGYVEDGSDCDDTDATLGKGATYYEDADGDGYGSADVTTLACEQPALYVDNALDCDDTASDINPDAEEVVDDIDNDCNDLIDAEDDNCTGDGCSSVSITAIPTGEADTSEDCTDEDPETTDKIECMDPDLEVSAEDASGGCSLNTAAQAGTLMNLIGMLPLLGMIFLRRRKDATS